MRLLSLVLILFSFFCSFGAREYITNTRQELDVPIARKGLTRIVFERDRVSKVIGNEDEYHIEGDNDTGQIFISPKTDGKIHVAIMTEKGLVQDINLLPDKTIEKKLYF
jgi:hypothetical protein